MPFTDINHLKIYYEVHGNGDSVVLLHHGFGCAKMLKDIYTDKSFLFDVEQGVDLYRHLTCGELAVLPKCGHNTYEHQPKECVHHTLSFLKRHHY